MVESGNLEDLKKIKMVIQQRICTGYRDTLLRKLSDSKDIDTILLIGDSLEFTKVLNTKNLDDINYIKLMTKMGDNGKKLINKNFNANTLAETIETIAKKAA